MLGLNTKELEELCNKKGDYILKTFLEQMKNFIKKEKENDKNKEE